MNRSKSPQSNSRTKPSLLEQRWFSLFVSVVQIMLWPVVRLFSPFLVRHSTSLLQRDDLRPGQRIIISSNHQCRIDHFLILGALPWRVYFQLLPYRYFTANRLFAGPLHPILLACGSFPAREHDRWPFGIDIAHKLLEKGQTIFIFPEGTRSQWRQRPARSGVAVLAQTSESQILPASVLWRKRGWFRQCSVVIGRPVLAKGLSAQEILELSFSLEPHHNKP